MQSQFFIRCIFYIAAFAVFVYQMTKSVEKYLEGPIVKSTSMIGLQDMTPPIFYVCQHDQMRTDVAQKYGYAKEDMIFLGELETHKGTSVPTWKGSASNLSFETILKDIYTYDYSKLKLENGNKTSENPSFLFPNDYCHELNFDLNLNKYGRIMSEKKIHLIARDPKRKNSLRIDYLPGAKQTVGPVRKENGGTLYEWARIQVKFVYMIVIYFIMQIKLYLSIILD